MVAVLAMLAGCAAANPAADSRARIRAGALPCEAVGAAVHLGDGLFLTAAHVVDGLQARLRGCPEASPVPRISFRGQEALALLLRAGVPDVAPGLGLRYLGGRDLAVLAAAASGPEARPCGFDAVPGARVLVAAPDRLVAARVLAVVEEEPRVFGAYAEISARLEPGESGSGVFDAPGRCLLGIVSHRAGPAHDRTRIVLAPALRDELAAALALAAARW